MAADFISITIPSPYFSFVVNLYQSINTNRHLITYILHKALCNSFTEHKQLRKSYLWKTANMSLRTCVVVKQMQSNPTLGTNTEWEHWWTLKREHWGSTPSISTEAATLGINTERKHWVPTLSTLINGHWGRNTARHWSMNTEGYSSTPNMANNKVGNWEILHQLLYVTEFGKTVETRLVSDELPEISLDQTKFIKWYNTKWLRRKKYTRTLRL